jgi:hypothetical protein
MWRKEKSPLYVANFIFPLSGEITSPPYRVDKNFSTHLVWEEVSVSN